MITSILGIFSGIRGLMPNIQVTEIKIVNKCVEECPKEYNGSKVKINKALRRCMV